MRKPHIFYIVCTVTYLVLLGLVLGHIAYVKGTVVPPPNQGEWHCQPPAKSTKKGIFKKIFSVRTGIIVGLLALVWFLFKRGTFQFPQTPQLPSWSGSSSHSDSYNTNATSILSSGYPEISSLPQSISPDSAPVIYPERSGEESSLGGHGQERESRGLREAGESPDQPGGLDNRAAGSHPEPDREILGVSSAGGNRGEPLGTSSGGDDPDGPPDRLACNDTRRQLKKRQRRLLRACGKKRDNDRKRGRGRRKRSVSIKLTSPPVKKRSYILDRADRDERVQRQIAAQAESIRAEKQAAFDRKLSVIARGAGIARDISQGVGSLAYAGSMLSGGGGSSRVERPAQRISQGDLDPLVPDKQSGLDTALKVGAAVTTCALGYQLYKKKRRRSQSGGKSK